MYSYILWIFNVVNIVNFIWKLIKIKVNYGSICIKLRVFNLIVVFVMILLV